MAIKININGTEIESFEGRTIVEIARDNNIDIPTLCHDERVKTYASCGICLVEVEGMPRLVRACSTVASNGMIIKTESEKVFAARKTALELLLSDHRGDCRPPCLTACPGKTDCQGYVGLIANGQYKEALKLIKDKIPLPACIGRVCPHPCETACRRELVEEPISIAHLKAFAADTDLASESPYVPDILPSTGKTVAVIGGGPGGLTAAYFLRRMGHAVTIYDAMSKMGGMLRYGIPEYRLPKAILDAEIDMIEKMGIKMVNGVKIGKDITIEHVKNRHDATVVAIGAWTSSPMRCPGEDLSGVFGGINFLNDVTCNKMTLTGKKIAVVGGGNTAMDAVRTAVRLGASEVYNIYRRTKAEMPAEDIEILEAEEEGVIFKYLTNPIEIVGENGKVSAIRLQKMELGEPDASGRRAPVAIKGAEETISLDTVIIAIGQNVDPSGMDGLNLTKHNTIIADEVTFQTNVSGVFAIGDAINKGASIAIEAIGDAKRAAIVIDEFLSGQILPKPVQYIVTSEKTREDFVHKQKIAREKMHHQKPEERKVNFFEVNAGYDEKQAVAEAKRCLECGCWDYFECRLVDYANRYDVKPERLNGFKHHNSPDVSNPFFYRNPDKCILCGLCVRVCDELMGRTSLGLVDRGFNTIIKPELGMPITSTDCISCGQCVTVCPTGALGEMSPVKNIPLAEKSTDSTCSFCSVGCKTQIRTKGTQTLRTLPNNKVDKQSILCAKGRFGLPEMEKQSHLLAPSIKKDGKTLEVSLDEALLQVTKKSQGLAYQFGADSLAVSISDKLTNEEIYLAKKYANEVLGTENVYSLNGVKSGLKNVFGCKNPTNTFEEIGGCDVIVLFADDIMNSHTIAGIRIKQAVENGAKLILISKLDTQVDEWATIKLKPTRNLQTLKDFAKVLLDMGKKPTNANGLDEFSKYIRTAKPSELLTKAASLYAGAKKAIFLFNAKEVTEDAATLIADIAVLAGHVGKPRAGVIPLLPNNNSLGLLNLGVNENGAELEQRITSREIKALIIFGEDAPGVSFKSLEFVAVFDNMATETTEFADVFIPLASAQQSNGTYTSFDRKLQKVCAAVAPKLANWEILQKLANVSDVRFNYIDETQILKEIGDTNHMYKNAYSMDFDHLFIPTEASPVLHQNGFHTSDKMAVLSVPTGNVMFTDSDNTHSEFKRFVNILDSKKLIK